MKKLVLQNYMKINYGIILGNIYGNYPATNCEEKFILKREKSEQPISCSRLL